MGTMKYMIVIVCSLALSQGATVGIEWKNNKMSYEFCIGPGDSINFKYNYGHNVEETSKEAYETCNVTQHYPVPGPIFWTAPNEEGVHYVVCGVDTHCALDFQKAIINVRNNCSSFYDWK